MIAGVSLAAGGAALAAWLTTRPEGVGDAALRIPAPDASEEEKLRAAIAAGNDLAGGNCEGEGPVELSAPPMKADDVAMILPYGLMVDGHVTPIDHQYFSPADFESAPDTYEVRALADGVITEISHRSRVVGDPSKPSNDYRFVFAHTCTFLTYFDLVTSLAPEIEAEFERNARGSDGFSYAKLNIPVRAGQVVGRIGGQTLDFAVWDTEKPLAGFVTPDLYRGERWKLYTADPLAYYGADLEALALEKYVRTDDGKSGRIDWDVDGRLVGNWFEVGTNAYEGDRQRPDGRYWAGHLAIAPDHLDPGYFIASFGTYEESGDGEQFVIRSPDPDPKDVGVATGPVKYELVMWSYEVDGERWDRRSAAKDPKITIERSPVQGCALFRFVETRELRAEPFPGQSCSEVSGFTENAKTFTR